MKLCITEKPSVARDIASIIGANNKRDGYYEGNGWHVSWTFGHLCCLKEPGDYSQSWKRWSLSALPMIPERFSIKLINDTGIKKQFKVLETLIDSADEIVNCGDSGQEGELIQRWVMQKAKAKCPVKRLWISSLTDEAIREGFSNLKPQENYDNLYLAGLSRAVGDWILGMNATRLYSLKYGQPGIVLSIGRVQTPTLALVVSRQHEIENFKPEDSWELCTNYRETKFTAQVERFKTEDDALNESERLSHFPFEITTISQKDGRESPPKLFDLTSLQIECNKRWGWSADHTLKLIQSLYEKKVTTYPRVDTTYLTEDIYPKIPTILRRMEPYKNLTDILLENKIAKSKRIFDNSKVTDHHAIIPTGNLPTSLVGDERNLYHLIALRFIAAFYPDCRFKTTTVEGRVDNTAFKATGKQIVEQGWRKIIDGEKNNDEEAQVLPSFIQGESGAHTPFIDKKTSQPPKPYTEGTLLRAMETAGRSVDDEDLREALKANGIGRPSTRAAIIETLFKRGYITRQRKSLIATDAGCRLISTIKNDLLKSAKLTGLWENKLRRIESGQYSAPQFIGELKTMVSQLVVDVLSDNESGKIVVEQENTNSKGQKPKGSASKKPRQNKSTSTRITKYEQISCPVCHTGHIIKGHTAYGCSRYKEGCTLRLSFTEYPETLTPSKLKAKLKS